MKKIIYREEAYIWAYEWATSKSSSCRSANSYKHTEAKTFSYFQYIKTYEMKNDSKIHALLNAFLYQEQLK